MLNKTKRRFRVEEIGSILKETVLKEIKNLD